VIKQRKTEEQFAADIFTLFSRYSEEPSSDRRQVYFGQICGEIIHLCDSIGIKANEMGIEIYNLVQRFVKKNNTNLPSDKTGFFKYLKKALYTAKKEYYRNNKTSKMDIPRSIRAKLKIVNDIIAQKEGDLGKKLTENERRHYIRKWFSMAEYTDLVNLKKTRSLESCNQNYGEDNEINHLNSKAKSLSTGNVVINPEEEYFTNLETPKIKNALEQLFQDTQERTRECYRSLFTAYCIGKSINVEALIPLLDNEILEAYRKNGKKPKQHQIYLKYHPEIKKDSASVRASDMTKDFLRKLRSILKLPN